MSRKLKAILEAQKQAEKAIKTLEDTIPFIERLIKM
jgi:hypothetical protein